MKTDIEKMKKLLSLDLPQAAVAAALGCSDSLVSQYMADNSFVADIAALRLVRLESATVRDEKLDALENTVIDSLKKSINYMIRPAELLGALKVLSAVPRKSTPSIASEQSSLKQVVNIVLPNAMAIAFIRSPQGEIVEANGRSLATLSAASLKQLVVSTQQQKIGVQSNGRELKDKSRRIEGTEIIEAAAA